MSEETDELLELGLAEIRKALEGIPIPEKWKSKLTYGFQITDPSTRTVELYVPGNKPQDAIVLATTMIDRKTRQTETKIHHGVFDGATD